MTTTALSSLRDRLPGRVVTPADEGWDQARMAWNVSLDQRPEAVVTPASPQETALAVSVAAEAGLRVAVQPTGHGAGPLGSLEGAILLRTGAMASVTVDAGARRAVVTGGAVWGDVTSAAGAHGLAALAGSAADVGVTGYTLGGGMGWLARRHGLACNAVRRARVVTADGRVVVADHENEPDLFWALRGGGGGFGAVTSLEMDLFPVAELYAGVLFWPIDRAAEILAVWRGWVDGLPDEVTSVGRLLRFPPMPEVPEPLRGNAFVVVEAACIGTEEEGKARMAPFRALGPVMDTFAMMPAARLAEVHMDPPEPVPYRGDGSLVSDLPQEAIDAVLAVAGPGVDSSLLSLEFRHLGGALGRPAADGGALSHIDAGFAVFSVGFTPFPEAVAAVEADIDRVTGAVAAWDPGRTYANFAERPAGAERVFGAAGLARLREVKQRVDPADVFLSNHPVTSPGG